MFALFLIPKQSTPIIYLSSDPHKVMSHFAKCRNCSSRVDDFAAQLFKWRNYADLHTETLRWSFLQEHWSDWRLIVQLGKFHKISINLLVLQMYAWSRGKRLPGFETEQILVLGLSPSRAAWLRLLVSALSRRLIPSSGLPMNSACTLPILIPASVSEQAALLRRTPRTGTMFRP